MFAHSLIAANTLPQLPTAIPERRPDSNFNINQLNYKKLIIHVWLMYTQLYTQLFFTSKPDSNESTKSREALQPNAIVPSQTKKA